MAQIPPRNPRRKAVRYGVPVAIAGVAAATVGLVPALADAGDPDLPKITAEELVAKMAKSDVQHMSGTVKVSTDLGLPSLPGSGSGGGGPFGSSGGDGSRGQDHGQGKDEDKSGAAPQDKLAELAAGEHTLRFAADGPDRQRLSIVEDAAEYSLVHNDRDLWGYDSGSNSAWHAKAPEDGKRGGKSGRAKLPDVTPQQAAKQALKATEKSSTVSVDGTAKVAGRDAYQLVIKPKNAPDTTVDSIRVAVDADNGTPLKFTLAPKEGGKAAVDVAYTKVDFGKPSADGFDFKPPKGAKVTEEKPGEKHGGKHGGPGGDHGGKPDLSGAGLDVLGKGVSDWGKVAKIKAPGDAAGALDLGKGQGKKGGEDGGARASQLLDSFTDEVKGDFGTGRVFSTRLVNALITDDGTIYAGAVTKDGLVKAAEADAK